MALNSTVYVCPAPGILCNGKAEKMGRLLGSHLNPYNSVM